MKTEIEKLKKKCEMVERAMKELEFWEAEVKKIDDMYNGDCFELNILKKEGNKFIGVINLPITNGYKIIDGYKKLVNERLESTKTMLKDFLLK